MTRRWSGASVPLFPHRYSGPVLVCGNAYCLSDDLGRARELYPDAPAIAVNGASGNVKALALFTLHSTKMGGWAELQRKKFGSGFTVHGVATAERAAELRTIQPWVEYWWHSSSRGTSTWAARKIATYMGFGPVILCGMPLQRGGYQNGKMAKFFQNDEAIALYRKMILTDPDWHKGVFSMSGWTRELFGAPVHP